MYFHLFHVSLIVLTLLIFKRPPRASAKRKSSPTPYPRQTRSVAGHHRTSKISNPYHRFCLLGWPKPPNDFLGSCCAFDASKSYPRGSRGFSGPFVEASWEQFSPRFAPEIADTSAV